MISACDVFTSSWWSFLCLCFFPFDALDGRCEVIVSIPDHWLHFYFNRFVFNLTVIIRNANTKTVVVVVVFFFFVVVFVVVLFF